NKKAISLKHIESSSPYASDIFNLLLPSAILSGSSVADRNGQRPGPIRNWAGTLQP
ncbi:hypothetical protein NDU88_005875, partial [Pleurodeles waltl]